MAPVRPTGRRVKIGSWPSGLYFARLRADDGRVGFAPFVVRPRRLGERRVAVVLPTLTWQAYNLRDEDGDGKGDLVRGVEDENRAPRPPYLSRGVPYNFRRYDLPFLHWLAWTGRRSTCSRSQISSRRRASRTRGGVRPQCFRHHEYVTTREYDLVEGYRNLGGNLMFLSANNFFWQVVKRGDLVTKTKLWRDLGRPEAALLGVQYLANGKAPRRPWLVRSAPRRRGSSPTGLREGSAFASGGVEIDRTSPASPRGVQVLAEIPKPSGRE